MYAENVYDYQTLLPFYVLSVFYIKSRKLTSDHIAFLYLVCILYQIKKAYIE